MPTLTTLEALRAYMLARLGNFGLLLGWNSSEEGALAEAAHDAILALGVDSIEQATNQKSLRAAAEYYAWVEVANNIGTYYTFESDGGKFNKSDLQKHANQAVERAYEKMVLSGIQVAPVIEIGEIDYLDNYMGE